MSNNSPTNLTATELRRAADLKDQIEALQSELDGVFGLERKAKPGRKPGRKKPGPKPKAKKVAKKKVRKKAKKKAVRKKARKKVVRKKARVMRAPARKKDPALSVPGDPHDDDAIRADHFGVRMQADPGTRKIIPPVKKPKIGIGLTLAYGMGVDSTAIIVGLARLYRKGHEWARPTTILFADTQVVQQFGG